VTEASGGIPGVPFYMALLLDVMGDRHEDPTASMLRMVDEHFAPGCTPAVDEEGLIRMDARELTPEIQDEMRRRYEDLPTGAAFPRQWYDAFMSAYARTRGFELPGVDYAAEFDTDEVCR
jgi:enoyl-[acyl-carrier protein] reductase/trans-2-enoyl-CoA reductase (NAD+)